MDKGAWRATQSMGHKESDTIKQLRMHVFLQNWGIHVKSNKSSH